MKKQNSKKQKKWEVEEPRIRRDRSVKKIKRHSSKENLKDIIQKYIDSRELDKSPNAWRHEDLIYNFILQMLGYIGKKLLE